MNLQQKDMQAADRGPAELALGDKSSRFPVRSGTSGPDVIDIGKLYKDTGCFTYDPGFTSTANCASGITFIDGDEGVLLYRGYPIDQLAEESDFVATCYLLLHGELPTNEQFIKFRNTIVNHTMVHEQMTRFFTGFRRDAHPMAIMVGVVGALSAFYHDSTDISDPDQRMVAVHRMIAKMPTIASMASTVMRGSTKAMCAVVTAMLASRKSGPAPVLVQRGSAERPGGSSRRPSLSAIVCKLQRTLALWPPMRL